MKGIVFLALIFFFNVLQAAPIKTSANLLNQFLQKNNASWVAKENHLTKKSKAEIKKLLGVRDFQEKDVRFSVPQIMTPMNMETVDWRNHNGKNWLGPIMDQANCGSCVAFAAIATLEGQVAIANNFPGLNPQFSTQALFACGGGACDWGWTPNTASNYMLRSGVVDEACSPYTMGATGQDMSCNQVLCADHKDRLFKIASVTRPTHNENIAAVKEALKKGPLMTTLGVYEDFMFYSSGVYKHTTGDYLGGHAVSLVGFSDEKRAWLIRNSWAEDWGEGGYGWVSWEDTSGVADETWGYVVPAGLGFASVRSPRTYDYVGGQFKIESEVTYQDLIAQTVVISKDGKSIKSIACGADASCVESVDSSDMLDGKYYIHTVAQTASGVYKSIPEFFYVANNQPELKIELSGKTLQMMQKPLKERPEFEIIANSSTVPMNEVEYLVWKKSTGEEVRKRATKIVLPGLKMGWRTNYVENGDYLIQFIGRVKVNGKAYEVATPKYAVTVKN